MFKHYRLGVIFLLLFTGFSYCQNINENASRYFDFEGVKNALWSGYAVNVSTGKVLFSKNEQFSLAPASGLKVVTTSAALELLGADYKYKTEIAVTGGINPQGVLTGDLILIGGGDPTLGSDRVKGSLNLDAVMKKFTDEIKKAGIIEIAGNVIAYDGFLGNETTPDNWYWVDMGNYYGAFVSGLTINDNLYELTFKPGKKTGDDTEVLGTNPQIPGLKFTNYVKTGKPGSGDNGYIYCAPHQYNAVLRGTVPAGKDKFSIKGSIPDPGYFAGYYLSEKLKETGIKITGEVKTVHDLPKYSSVIYTHYSPALSDIVYYINKRSFNLYTEHLLRTIAKETGDEPTLEEGVKIIKKFMESKNVDVAGVQMYDGCGLSRSNMITTKMMCELLAYMKKSENFNPLYNSLAVAGDPDDPGYYSGLGKGTLLEKNARIKSGTIERVRSFSGYLTNVSGELISFSFIANNYSGSRRDIDNLHTNLMLLLAETK